MAKKLKQNESSLAIALHKKQTIAFQSDAREILYGGAAGGGKSHLMRVAAISWCTQIPGLQVYLFRRLSDDLYKNHMEGAGGFFALLAPWFRDKLCRYNGSKNFIEFWNGAKIWLCHCQHEKDIIKYQGPEIHVLMMDELTHFTEKQYRFLRGRCRIGALEIPHHLDGLFPRILAGSNPGSLGHNWVKRTFVDNAPYMDVVKMPREEGGLTRQYIPAVLSDNPSQDSEYENQLAGLGSDELVRAMLNGDWDIVAGGAFDDVWSRQYHVVPQFKIPYTWRIDRSFDWGSSTPFSVGWWAEANGEEAVLPDGRRWCPPAGSLIRFAEWYGIKAPGSNEGLRLSPKEIAEGIISREKMMRKLKWIGKNVQPGPADNQIWNEEKNDLGVIDSIASRMQRAGITWKKSNKTPGSRKNGLQLMRERFRNVLAGEGPGLYATANCKGFISTIPVLTRDDEKDPEDVAKGGEDHVYDESRYRTLASDNRYAQKVDVKFKI